jgi:hypothetical protein
MLTMNRLRVSALLLVCTLGCEEASPTNGPQADGGGGAVGDADVTADTGPAGGAPVGGMPVGGAPLDAVLEVDAEPDAGEPACITGTYWTGGNRESPLMRPGAACIECHARGEGPAFEVAGTVYAGFHQESDCNGASDVEVELTGADGRVFTLTSNRAGNFFLGAGRGLQTPYTAKLIVDGQERPMVTPQVSGDCNACHTELGASGAPGRIRTP